jgi:hypothetical protein
MQNQERDSKLGQELHFEHIVEWEEVVVIGLCKISILLL